MMIRKPLALCAATAVMVVVGGGWSFGQAQSAGDERNPGLAENLLASVREAEPGEFATAEDVVRRYLEAVRKQDIDAAIECFPVKRMLERQTLAQTIDFLRFYDPANSSFPMPEADALQRFRVLAGVVREFYGLSNVLIHLDIDYDSAKRISGDADEAKAQIAGIVEKVREGRAKLKEFEIKKVSVKEQDLMERHSSHRLGATKVALVNVQIAHRSKTLSLEFFVEKYEANWLIVSQDFGPSSE